MHALKLIAAGLALSMPVTVLAHPEGHWRDHREHRLDKKAERHYRKAAKHLRKAHRHVHAARRHRAAATRSVDVVHGRVLAVVPVYGQHHGGDTPASCIHWRQSHGHGGAQWVPAVLGGVVGGAVGYHLGEDHGDPEFATVAGTLIGASLGHSVGRHSREARDIRVVGPCTPDRAHRYERSPVEYRVTYRYNGRIYHEFLDYDPGEWVVLNVEVSPA